MLQRCRYAAITETDVAERLDCGHLGRVLLLTLLAPDLAEAIPDGRQSCGLGPLRDFASLPTCWAARRLSRIQSRRWSGSTRPYLDGPRRNNPLFYAWRPRAGTAHVDLAAAAATPPAGVASAH